MKSGEALCANGWPAAEITFRTAAAEPLIREVVKRRANSTSPNSALLPTECAIEPELRPGEIDIDGLAERLTGVPRKILRSVAEAFPPMLAPADAPLSVEARDVIAQMESFIRR